MSMETYTSSSSNGRKKPLTQKERLRIQKSYASVPHIIEHSNKEHEEKDIPEAEKLMDILEKEQVPSGQAASRE